MQALQAEQRREKSIASSSVNFHRNPNTVRGFQLVFCNCVWEFGIGFGTFAFGWIVPGGTTAC
jgi:hypothetical protein